MNFEDFDFANSNQCGITQADPITTYTIENFLNKPGVSFAAIPLNFTEKDFQDLNKLHIDNSCEFGDQYGQNACEVGLSYQHHPISYYQGKNTFYENVENHFKQYESLISEPELVSRIVDLIARVTIKAAEIIPGAFIRPFLRTYSAESGMGEIPEFWHQDGTEDHMCSERSYIFLATLKGNPTLFCTGSYDSDVGQCAPDNTGTITFSAPVGVGAVQKNSRLYGAYHSSPLVNEQRLVFIAEIRHPDCHYALSF